MSYYFIFVIIIVGSWTTVSSHIRLCGSYFPLRRASTFVAIDCPDAAVQRGVTDPSANRGGPRGLLCATADRAGGLVLLEALAVARGSRALLQHRREQVRRVGRAAVALVLL